MDVQVTRFKATSDALQKRDTNLDTAQLLLESLHSFVAKLRDQFSQFEKSSWDMKCVTQFYQHETQRRRKRKIFADESMENDEILNGSNFRWKTYNVISDRLLFCLAKRIDAYKDLNGLFGVLFDTDTDCDVCINVLLRSHPHI